MIDGTASFDTTLMIPAIAHNVEAKLRIPLSLSNHAATPRCATMERRRSPSYDPYRNTTDAYASRQQAPHLPLTQGYAQGRAPAQGGYQGGQGGYQGTGGGYQGVRGRGGAGETYFETRRKERDASTLSIWPPSPKHSAYVLAIPSHFKQYSRRAIGETKKNQRNARVNHPANDVPPSPPTPTPTLHHVVPINLLNRNPPPPKGNIVPPPHVVRHVNRAKKRNVDRAKRRKRSSW